MSAPLPSSPVPPAPARARGPRRAAAEGRRRARLGALLVAGLGLLAAGCESLRPVAHVEAPPCDCSCRFQASTPQIGKGCWVNGDVLVCPLVRRTLDIEPAYPSEDPRCETLESGEIRCEVHPGDVEIPEAELPETPPASEAPSAPSS